MTTPTVISTVPMDKENFAPDDVSLLVEQPSPVIDKTVHNTGANQPTSHTPSTLPALRSFDTLEVIVDGAELSSIEKLKSRFYKHVTIKDKVKKPPVGKEAVTSETTTSAILSQDELSQPGLAPGGWGLVAPGGWGLEI